MLVFLCKDRILVIEFGSGGERKGIFLLFLFIKKESRASREVWEDKPSVTFEDSSGREQ